MAERTVWTLDTGTAFASSASREAIIDIAERAGLAVTRETWRGEGT